MIKVDSSTHCCWAHIEAIRPGMLATIPPKMMIERPFPMPSLVMISPSQIANIVPPANVKSVEEAAKGHYAVTFYRVGTLFLIGEATVELVAED